MHLSSEQMLAVNQGLPSKQEWSWVDLPVGPQRLPRWAKGLQITSWRLAWGNDPDFVLKCDRDLRSWDNQWYAKDGDRYMAAHADGRADVYYHGGRVSLTELERHVRTGRKGWHKEKYEALATTQQEGFGGSHYHLRIGGKGEFRGKTIVVRGPWHGGTPAGYVGASYVDTNAKWRGSGRTPQPWYRWTAMGGLYITEDLFLRLVARFQPHVRVARVHHTRWERLVLVHPDWPTPKQFLSREYRSAAKEAA